MSSVLKPPAFIFTISSLLQVRCATQDTERNRILRHAMVVIKRFMALLLSERYWGSSPGRLDPT
jgi:hypothetical protein